MAKDKEGFEALIPFFMPEKANMAIRMQMCIRDRVLSGSVLTLKIWTGINMRAFFEEYG